MSYQNGIFQVTAHMSITTLTVAPQYHQPSNIHSVGLRKALGWIGEWGGNTAVTVFCFLAKEILRFLQVRSSHKVDVLNPKTPVRDRAQVDHLAPEFIGCCQ
jgi:hypothetical protein